MLFAGFMSNVEEIVVWLRWMQYISPLRYTLEIGFRGEFKEEDFSIDDELNKYPVDGYNYDLGTGWCFFIMIMITVLLRVLGYFFLKLQTINT